MHTSRSIPIPSQGTWASLPVAAELVVNKFESRKVGLAGVRIVLDDLFQLIFIHLVAQVGIALLGRGTRGGIGFLYLPQNVCRAPCSLCNQRRFGKHLDQAGGKAAARYGRHWPDRGDRKPVLPGLQPRPSAPGLRSGCPRPPPLWPASSRRWGRCFIAAKDGGVALVLLFNVGIGVNTNPRAALFCYPPFRGQSVPGRLFARRCQARCKAT